MESYPPAYVHLMPSKQKPHGQSYCEDICTIVTTLFHDLNYSKKDIIDYLLPPSRHPNLTMRIQHHAVFAWLSLEHIATDATAVAVGTCLFGTYFSRRHFFYRYQNRGVYGCKRPGDEDGEWRLLGRLGMNCGWLSVFCITPRAEYARGINIVGCRSFLTWN